MTGAWTANPGVPALRWWLIAVGTFRSGYTWSCFFGSATFCSATFSEIEMTGVHERTIAVWTLLSCTLCFLCAFNLRSKPVYAATFLSFVYALGYLALECFVYHTMRADRLSLFIFIAGTSIVWMLLQWNSHGHAAPVSVRLPSRPDTVYFPANIVGMHLISCVPTNSYKHAL